MQNSVKQSHPLNLTQPAVYSIVKGSSFSSLKRAKRLLNFKKLPQVKAIAICYNFEKKRKKNELAIYVKGQEHLKNVLDLCFHSDKSSSGQHQCQLRVKTVANTMITPTTYCYLAIHAKAQKLLKVKF